ncbi:MAG: MFS transporter [Advenella sp.]|uniref:MFS transporter n=1 Tax=Advenella sp. TaxID=1872388 RepID=UPI003F96A3C3
MNWQDAEVVLCIVMLALLPLAACLRDPTKLQSSDCTKEAQIPINVAIRQAFHHRGFWLLNLGFMACSFLLAFITTQMPAYLLEQGLNMRQAGTLLAIIALANVFSTYGCARLGGRRYH